MIVIEGKNQKSKILENLIRKNFMTNSVLVIDSVGVKSLEEKHDFKHVIIEAEDYTEVIETFELGYDKVKDFDWIAFYVNADKSALNDFKDLDRKYTQNFIVTIQSNNGLTSTYYI